MLVRTATGHATHQTARAEEPPAIEAASEVERMHRERQDAACNPDNRLIAAQLEKSWETTRRRLQNLETRQPIGRPTAIDVDPNAFANIAENLSAAWNGPGVTMRASQQLLRT